MGECLGCGATGAVYHAWWQGSEVAVKQLSLFCLDSRHIADFYAEAVRETCNSIAMRFIRNPPHQWLSTTGFQRRLSPRRKCRGESCVARRIHSPAEESSALGAGSSYKN
jgi:hypothetical protein